MRLCFGRAFSLCYNLDMYAQIIIDISHEKLDKPFSYRIPSEMDKKVLPGTKVVIPFRNREIFGYVVELSETVDFDESKVKDILSVCDEAIAADVRMVALAYWIKRNFGGTLNASLKTVLPVKEKVKPTVQRFIKRSMNVDDLRSELAEIASKKNASEQKIRLLEALLEDEIIPWEVATGKLFVGSAVIRDLEKRKLLIVEEKDALRNPLSHISEGKTPPTLNENQRQIVDSFLSDYKNDIRNVYLLRGVTGSGKTEVYMEMMAGVLADGKQAIFLIPEISLTFQTVMRLYGRFKDRISILNSKMSIGERHDQMERAKRGEIDILIGPRSALFAPFSNLGLIIIDEEHEPSYKSESVPKYHARETAIELAKMTGSSVVLGSATPSVESYEKAKRGEYKLYELTERAVSKALPECEIVDLREELKRGNRSMLSKRTHQLMEETFAKKEQAILFLNRRGVAGFISCRSCGDVIKCPHCDVSLTEHYGNKLVCHYCGYTQAKPSECPSCGSKFIKGFKAGTEKVEELVQKEFPGIRTLRMDADTTSKKGDYEEILTKFKDGGADVLIGTQMIVKGHDFPKVTFVGILAADLSLNDHDFRAHERTFQLLTQAAGRSGRGDLPGKVVIQTYKPEDYAVEFGKTQDYEGFFEKEIAYRKLLDYPPVGHMLNLLLTSPDLEALNAATNALKNKLNEAPRNLLIMGPKDAGIAKIQDIHRKEVYIKARKMESLVQIKDELETFMIDNYLFRKIQSQFDFDL